VKPLRSNNPFFIAFHEWIALARDLWQARTLRDRWSYLFGPPGWRPDHNPESTLGTAAALENSSIRF
jgi:hypothetical protein